MLPLCIQFSWKEPKTALLATDRNCPNFIRLNADIFPNRRVERVINWQLQCPSSLKGCLLVQSFVHIIQVFCSFEKNRHFARSTFCLCKQCPHQSFHFFKKCVTSNPQNKIFLCCNLDFTTHFILCFTFQALCNAVENEKVEKIRSILEHNPHLDVTHRNSDKLTPLDIAFMLGNQEIADILVKHKTLMLLEGVVPPPPPAQTTHSGRH